MNSHMPNSFNVSSLLSQLPSSKTGRNVDSGVFADSFSFALEMEISVSDVGMETTPQTVEDVKKEFYAYLDSLPMTTGNTQLTVHVTDAAFEKMLADPEYKQKMMDLCKRDLCDPAWAGGFLNPAVMTVHIDADCEEEYLASSYGSAVTHMADTSNPFWSKRSEKGKAAREIAQEKAQERKEMLELLQEKALTRKQAAANLLNPD